MAIPILVPGARAALKAVTLRGQVGRISRVISNVGRGPPAWRILRRLFQGMTRGQRQYVLNKIGLGVGIQPRPGRQRLFLKDIPIIPGLFGEYSSWGRVRYGVEVTWVDTNTGQTGTVFRRLDYDAPQLTEDLVNEAAENVKEDIITSPKGFGAVGKPNVEILEVSNIYTHRAF